MLAPKPPWKRALILVGGLLLIVVGGLWTLLLVGTFISIGFPDLFATGPDEANPTPAGANILGLAVFGILAVFGGVAMVREARAKDRRSN